MSASSFERLEHPDAQTRALACQEIAISAPEDGTVGADVLAALGDALRDPAKQVVRAASDALVAIAANSDGAIASNSAGVISTLECGLQADSFQARFGAAFALARIQPADARVVPVLLEALSEGDGDIRWAALRLLVAAGPTTPGVQTTLTRLATEGQTPAARRIAAFGLRDLAPEAASTAKALLSASRDPDVHVRRAALSAMVALIDPAEPLVDRLIGALEEADGGSRRIAAVALGALSARHPALAPRVRGPLRQALASTDENLCRAATRALARIDPTPKNVEQGEPLA